MNKKVDVAFRLIFLTYTLFLIIIKAIHFSVVNMFAFKFFYYRVPYSR